MTARLWFSSLWMALFFFGGMQFVLGGDSTEELPTVEEVYRNYLQMNGGRGHIESIQSIAVRADLISEEGTVEASLYRKRPNLMRLTLDFDDYSVETRFDGEQGCRWIVGPDGTRIPNEVDSMEVERMAESSRMESPFFELGRRPDHLALVGEDTVRGHPCFKIVVNEAQESRMQALWISQEHFQEIKVLYAAGAAIEEVYYSDYREIDGLRVAGLAENWAGGEKIDSLRVKDVQTNPGIFDSFFVCP